MNERKHLAELMAFHNCAAVARRLGCDKRTVSRWVLGTSVPPADKLFALAEIIRVDPRCIAVGSEDEADRAV